MPVQGVDISTSQGTIDWDTVLQAGIQFACIKASEALNTSSPARVAYFRSNWKKTRAAGILRGAYHFFRANTDSELQAEAFVKVIQDAGGLQDDDLPPMLDVETSDDTARDMIILRAHRCLDKIQAELGVKPFIYTYRDFWDNNLDDSFGDYPLWLADYPDPVNLPTPPTIPERPRPVMPVGFTDCVIWQYGSRGQVDGIQTPDGTHRNVDLNLFDGTLDDLQAFSASMRS